MGIMIAIDGLDGSGKKTQWELLYEKLISEGLAVRKLTFPQYGSPACACVEQYLSGAYGTDPNIVNPYAASSFYAVDRYASYMLDWKKDYDNGTIILSNRYTTANAIHQLAKLPNEKRDSFLEWLYGYEFGLLGLPKPDMTLFFDVPVENSLALIEARGDKKDIHETRVHLSAARSAAIFACEKLGWTRIICTDDGKMLSREEIADRVYVYVKGFFEKKELM
ncbi:Thymidylate kinase [bioreactor metagenome]|uniref:Thymidylate kinase n=1 Tax=bioreactor metagenome TaxID=1076179 RepID=A0A645BYF4_9ZZZZ|nr:thymidylate kinase [Oscillospiraceae bacterium]